MNKHVADRKALIAILALIAGCSAHPVIESYRIEPGAGVQPPHDAVQYFLPRRLISVTVQRTRTRRDTVTVRTLPAVPDLSLAYYARIPASALRDDSFALRTTASGLLTSITSTSRDEAPAIAVAATELVALVPQLVGVAGALNQTADALAAAAHPLAPQRPVVPDATPCGKLGDDLPGANGAAGAAFKATVILDPTSSTDLARAEAELCTRGANFRFVTVPVTAPADASGVLSAASASGPDKAYGCVSRPVAGLHCDAAVHYRRDQPYVFTIYDAGATRATGFTLVSAALIQVPNAAAIESLSMTAGAGVSTRLSSQFSDGMLTSAGATRPSPALAFVSFPLQIAKAIVSIPSALFQFRVDSARDTARLVEAQTEAIKAETARLNAAAALRAKEESAALDSSDSLASDENRDLQH